MDSQASSGSVDPPSRIPPQTRGHAHPNQHVLEAMEDTPGGDVGKKNHCGILLFAKQKTCTTCERPVGHRSAPNHLKGPPDDIPFREPHTWLDQSSIDGPTLSDVVTSRSVWDDSAPVDVLIDLHPAFSPPPRQPHRDDVHVVCFPMHETRQSLSSCPGIMRRCMGLLTPDGHDMDLGFSASRPDC